MRRVVASEIEVETCKVHGVWFDAGDLAPLVHAVALALGKPVPSVIATLDATVQHDKAKPAELNLSGGLPRPHAEPSDLEVAASIAGAAIDAVYSPIEAAADVVLFPFRVVGLLSELVD